jgi:hypothetical protein
MMSRGLALLPLLVIPLDLVAQGYGRPDSAQNDGGCKILTCSSKSRFGSDLEKLKRVRWALVDSPTAVSELYEGVPLLHPRYRVRIEVSLDSRHNVTIPNVDLDATQNHGVDIVDGKTLAGDIRYYFLAKRECRTKLRRKADHIQVGRNESEPWDHNRMVLHDCLCTSDCCPIGAIPNAPPRFLTGHLPSFSNEALRGCP